MKEINGKLYFKKIYFRFPSILENGVSICLVMFLEFFPKQEEGVGGVINWLYSVLMVLIDIIENYH